MVKYFIQHKIILTLILILVLMAVFISACNLINLGGGETTATPTTSDILAPAPGAKVLQGAPVQIQSTFTDTNISRVELLIQEPGAQTAKLIRSDIPTNQMVLQQWVPIQTGPHTVTVRAYVGNDSVITRVRTYEVVADSAITLAPVTAAEVAGSSGPAQPTVIPLTPLPISPGAGASGFGTPDIAQVVATSTPAPLPTPTPFYPPPPPQPGVPPGPVQSPLLNVHPPVCDDAKYLGPYTTDNSRRIDIKEADAIPARVVGGVTVFRAWKLQNVGTCTWGPGYELAFYGGRSMGSGGVAFESTFPGEPARRNLIIDQNRLVVPEGKPNQVAILEVALVTPVTPGIHQSYWRMRNPHGVFFGPIIGVTMEVVRDCELGLYGAPSFNKFEILGYGSVFRPSDPSKFSPTEATVEVGTTVIMDYSIINSTNFDIIFEDPVGNTRTESHPEQNGRIRFEAKIENLGWNTISLYIDNGFCAIGPPQIPPIRILVTPRAGEQFQLDLKLASNAPVSSTDPNVAFSSAVTPGTIQAEWQHFDPEVNQIVFHADLYQRRRTQQCLIDNWLCFESGDWQRVRQESSGQVGSTATGAATVCLSSSGCGRLPTEIGGAQQAQGQISEAEHRALLGCPANAGSEANVEYRVGYYADALKDGTPANPPRSNQVFINCTTDASSAGLFDTPVSDMSASCTLTQLGGITLPFACNEVPIVAGVALVLLLAVGWFFFR